MQANNEFYTSANRTKKKNFLNSLHVGLIIAYTDDHVVLTETDSEERSMINIF